MAQEPERVCGWRKVGGLYVIGEAAGAPCDRLPYPIINCPVCQSGIKFSRGFQRLNFARYAGSHNANFIGEPITCQDGLGCPICSPGQFKQPYYLLWVGKEYTPTSFTDEANRLGISKRIPAVPRGIKIGDIVLLAHNDAAKDIIFTDPFAEEEESAIVDNTASEEPSPDEPPHTEASSLGRKKPDNHPGIFMSFTVSRFEKLLWQSEATQETINGLASQGIRAVIIKDGDVDHDPKVKTIQTPEQLYNRKLTELKNLFPRKPGI